MTPHDRGAAARALFTGLILGAVAALVMASTDEPGSTAGDRLARLGAVAPALGAVAAAVEQGRLRRRGELRALALAGASPLRQALGPALGGALLGALGAAAVASAASLRSLLPALPGSPWRVEGAALVAPALGLRLASPGGPVDFLEPTAAAAGLAGPRAAVVASLLLGAGLAPWWAAGAAPGPGRAALGALALLGALVSFHAVAAGAPAGVLLVPPLVPGAWLLAQIGRGGRGR